MRPGKTVATSGRMFKPSTVKLRVLNPAPSHLGSSTLKSFSNQSISFSKQTIKRKYITPLKNTTFIGSIHRSNYERATSSHYLVRTQIRNFCSNTHPIDPSYAAATHEDVSFEGNSEGLPDLLPYDTIVKVFASQTSPNYFLPWQMKATTETTGSGFVVRNAQGQLCILTNAHVVSNQTFVSVRRFGSSIKFTAQAVAIGHDSDLAMLSVEDPLFWQGVTPLEFGKMPELQDVVQVVGYPTGGDNISITQGVVSRIELQQYVHGAINLLSIQIDAAINSGNSGGPVLKDNKIVGVSFQNIPNAENIGYIIPVPIVEHFLNDVKKKQIGFGVLGIQCQGTDNKYMRQFLKMKPHQTGVLINAISPTSKAKGILQKDDVVLAVDGVKIANDGTIPFRNRGERVSFDYLVTSKYLGDKCRITFLRDGKQMEVDVEVGPRKFLVPVHAYDKRPSYFLHGGLVFTKLVQPYLHEYGEDWMSQCPKKLLHKAIYGELDHPNQEVVVLAHVLVDEINFGYQHMTNLEVLKVNGTKVENLKHLVSLVENNKEKHVRFDLEDHMVIILDTENASKAGPRILDKYCVPGAKSQDLLTSE